MQNPLEELNCQKHDSEKGKENRGMHEWMHACMDGRMDEAAIKLGDKLQIAAGLFNSLILKTRKTICFYPPAMPIVLCVYLSFLLFDSSITTAHPSDPNLSKSIFLDPSVFITSFSHSVFFLFPIFLDLFFFPLIISLSLSLSHSGPLGNQRT